MAQWERVAKGAKEELAALPLNERAQLLAELLTSHGYMAEADADRVTADEALIREHNCVLRAVAEQFPEVCVGRGAVSCGVSRRGGGAAKAHREWRELLRVLCSGIGNRESGIGLGRLKPNVTNDCSHMSSSIESLINKEYQAGFETDIESDTIAPGLVRGDGPAHLGQEERARSGCSTGVSRRSAAGRQ